MKRKKFEWNIFMDGHWLVLELNGGLNCRIDSRQRETFEKNKKEKLEEIQYFSSFTKTNISGIELLQ